MNIYKFLSYFFHPINYPILGSFLFFLFVPQFIYKPQEYAILATVFIGTYLFPMLLLFIMKKSGMIISYHMRTIDERKFPTLLFISICFIMGNWIYKSNSSELLSLFFFGYGVGLVLSYIILFLKLKISLHTAAMGGLIGFVMCFSYYYELNLISLLTALFVLGGFIATARLKLVAHKYSEVIIGFFLGFLSQIAVFIAYMI